MATHHDLDVLCGNALLYGASAAVRMAARGIVMDPRVRLKCMVPRCSGYGVNLMCPPSVMSGEDFAHILKRYMHTIVMQYPIPLDRQFMNEREGKSIEVVYHEKEYFERMVTSERAFMELLDKLERDAMNMGYRFAAALTGGPCRLCDECVGPNSDEKCRHPFRSRPPMEAMGIDVYQTAKNAGVPFEIPPRDHPVWTGLLLVD
jgi:predicted metal-binding protein